MDSEDYKDSEQKKGKKSFFTAFIEVTIVCSTIGILAAMAIPNHKRSHPISSRKKCYSNIRVLQGAVEMYNMDHMTMISTSLDLKPLEDGKYIKNVEHYVSPQIPEISCKYDIDGDITDVGQVYCHYHGSVGPDIPGQAKD